MLKSGLRQAKSWLAKLVRLIVSPPLKVIRGLQWYHRGARHSARMRFGSAPAAPSVRPSSDLRDYVEAVHTGPGIWKWDHYLEIYETHFARFRGKSPTIVEIGVYSGGSISMWQAYFGPECRVIGVDIEEACRVYERDGVDVMIGDQADPAFWQAFRKRYPKVDIIVDDGGHLVHQQVATLEGMLAHLWPGGVYMCEDVHGIENQFLHYICGLGRSLNAEDSTLDLANPARRVVCRTSAFQSGIRGIHLYPFVVVIERREAPVMELVAPKRGTQWQPFGDAWDNPSG